MINCSPKNLITLAGILLVISFLIYLVVANKVDNYIAGKYGEYCYPEGEENNNIKYPIEFKTLDECLNYIKR